MQVDLTVTNKQSGESSIISLAVEDRVLVGRDLSSPVQLQGVGLSREHFAFFLDNGRLVLEDLSRNGTWLNGKLLGQNLTVPLEQGDVVEVPGHSVLVTFPGPAPVTPDAASSPAQAPPAKPTWARILSTATDFFTIFEVILILSAAFTYFLIFYYTSL